MYKIIDNEKTSYIVIYNNKCLGYTRYPKVTAKYFNNRFLGIFIFDTKIMTTTF